MTMSDVCDRARKAIGEPVVASTVLGGGRNSRVFRANTPNGSVVVKYYFRHPRDPRDRQLTEFQALTFLAEQGVDRIPDVRHVDREAGFTILSFIDGECITDAEMTTSDENDFRGFTASLQRVSRAPDATRLAAASEAFFTLDGVLGNLDVRLARLKSRPESEPLARELDGFLEGRFIPALEVLSSRAKVYYRDGGLEPGREIDAPERVLSPSDFGLHNCVKSTSGLFFLDFEYFGWDDPAKLVSDFVLHPAQGEAGEGRYRVAGRMAGLFLDRPGFAVRLAALLPLFGLKWCMIVLNEFLAGENARRAFAGTTDDHEFVLRRQLGLAGAMLDLAGSDVATRLIEQN